MDWPVLKAVTLVGAYAGYLIGLLVRRTFIESRDPHRYPGHRASC